MKKRITLMLMLCIPIFLFAQTLYYQRTEIIEVNSNFSFLCDNDEGDITLSASTDIYVDAEWTKRDGSPLPVKVHEGYVKTLNISDEMFELAKTLVTYSFPVEYRSILKDIEFQVTLIINPENGKVWEVHFSFYDDELLCQVPPVVFYNIRISLMSEIQVEMTDVGRDLNYAIFGWGHVFKE